MHTHTDNTIPDAVSKEMLREQLLAYAYPNVPADEEQDAAMERAILYQWQHEQTALEATGGQPLPEGIAGFTAASFSMTFRNGNGASRADQGICPSARAALLRAGLLYRGLGNSQR